MNMPFRRTKPLPVRMLTAVAARAGDARGIVRKGATRLKRRG